MAVKILEVKKKEIPPAWLGEDAQDKSPDVLFRISIEEIKQPPYDVPKTYSNRVKNILKKAKADLEEKNKQEYSREDAVRDFFEAQDTFAKHKKL